MMSDFDKEGYFTSIWALSGRNAFPDTLRKEYIDTLWKNFGESKKLLKKKELLSSSDAAGVFKKIAVYDKELAIFKSFIKRFNQLSPKAIRFLKSPDLSPVDKKTIQDLQAKEYTVTGEDSEDTAEWTIQEVIQEPGKKTKIGVNRRSARLMKGKIKERDIEKETWDKFEEEVKGHFNDVVESLQDVMVTVTAPYRFQVGIEFDWENDTTELLSDVTEWNEDEGRPEERQTARTSALSFLAEKLELGNKNSFAGIDSKGEIKDPKLRTKLEKRNTADYLIVMRGGTYHLAGSETENEEDVKARLRLFDMHKITEAAKSYYAEKGTFSGFFDAYKNFDRNLTKVQGGVLSNENPLDCSGIFLKIFDSIEPASEAYKGTKLEGKEVEVVSFEYQNTSGEWIIRTPNYSGRVRDAFISELNKLSQKPSKRPKPTVGKAP
jgi:hypothetical protein